MGRGSQGLCVAEGSRGLLGLQEGVRGAGAPGQHEAGGPVQLGSPGLGHQASGKALPLQGSVVWTFPNASDSWQAWSRDPLSLSVHTHPNLASPTGTGLDSGFLPPVHAFWGPWLPSCSPSLRRKLQGMRETSSPPRGPWLTHSLGGRLRTQACEGSAGA